MAGDKIVVVTKENFESEVLKSDKPVFVDFWASWCGPCRLVAPVMEMIADEYRGRVKVAKVNVDEEPELSARFRVRSIPAVILFKDGGMSTYRDEDNHEIEEKYIGVRSKSEYTEILNKHL